ncbi:MAG: ABC transporter ATP-binding protein [Acidimicrobiales bacterium]
MTGDAAPVIYCRGVAKTYHLGRSEVRALDGIDVTVLQGEMVAIMGPSGSGKSTLLHLLGCLDRPDAGQYLLDGIDVSTLGRDRLAAVRNTKVGLVFQGFNLLERTSAADNVAAPLAYAGVPRRQRRLRATEALERVGLADRASHQPTELSGGEQQRVAIARALVVEPALVLADEPTGALDTTAGAAIMGLFEELNAQGTTIVVVTHEPAVAARAPRLLRMRDGRLA